MSQTTNSFPEQEPALVELDIPEFDWVYLRGNLISESKSPVAQESLFDPDREQLSVHELLAKLAVDEVNNDEEAAQKTRIAAYDKAIKLAQEYRGKLSVSEALEQIETSAARYKTKASWQLAATKEAKGLDTVRLSDFDPSADSREIAAATSAAEQNARHNTRPEGPGSRYTDNGNAASSTSNGNSTGRKLKPDAKKDAAEDTGNTKPEDRALSKEFEPDSPERAKYEEYASGHREDLGLHAAFATAGSGHKTEMAEKAVETAVKIFEDLANENDGPNYVDTENAALESMINAAKIVANKSNFMKEGGVTQGCIVKELTINGERMAVYAAFGEDYIRKEIVEGPSSGGYRSRMASLIDNEAGKISANYLVVNNWPNNQVKLTAAYADMADSDGEAKPVIDVMISNEPTPEADDSDAGSGPEADQNGDADIDQDDKPGTDADQGADKSPAADRGDDNGKDNQSAAQGGQRVDYRQNRFTNVVAKAREIASGASDKLRNNKKLLGAAAVSAALSGFVLGALDDDKKDIIRADVKDTDNGRIPRVLERVAEDEAGIDLNDRQAAKAARRLERAKGIMKLNTYRDGNGKLRIDDSDEPLRLDESKTLKIIKSVNKKNK